VCHDTGTLTQVNTLAKVVDGLHRQLGTLLREIVKFGIVGGLAFIVDVGLFNALHSLDKPVTAKLISGSVATVVAYLGNRAWTFRHRDRSGLTADRELLLFFGLNGVGMGIAAGCLAVSHYGLGFTGNIADNIAANGVGLVLGTVFRFWSYRRWVFPSSEPTELPPMTESVGIDQS
jgi:putative flippase GtrA